MKTITKLLISALFLVSMAAFVSCGDDSADCPGKTFSSFAECDKEASDAAGCICVQDDDGNWKSIPNNL
jgi:hypothetical protein